MFDISFSELLIIALVALIVLGPKRLPEVARTAGRWLGRIRRFMENVKQDLDREMNSQELAEFKKLQEELAQTRSLIQHQGDKTWELVSGEAKTSETTVEAPKLEAPKPKTEPVAATASTKKAVKRRPRRPRSTKKPALTDEPAKKTDGQNP